YFFGVIERHLAATAHSGYRFGLARMIILRTAYNPLWLLIFAGGTYASVAEFREHGWRRNKFMLVMLIFAVVQPLWVKYFYDQYLYTVLLVWSLPLALFLHRAGKWRSQLAQGALAVLLLAGVF